MPSHESLQVRSKGILQTDTQRKTQSRKPYEDRAERAVASHNANSHQKLEEAMKDLP